MKKTLITFLGTGPRRDKKDTSSPANPPGDYKRTNYQITEGGAAKVYSEKTFIATALEEHCRFDQIIMIGTSASMWHEAYSAFCALRGHSTNEDIYYALGEYTEASQPAEKPQAPFEKLESLFGENGQAIIIPVGRDEEELNQIQTTILGLPEIFPEGCHVSVDITHSFRSLPVFILSSIFLLGEISPKNITVENIFYGMFENRESEKNITPVVNLKSMVKTQEYLIAAHNFRNFGNAYKLHDLLYSNSKLWANELIRFSEHANINAASELQKDIRSISQLNPDQLPDIPKQFVPAIAHGLRETLDREQADADYYLDLAEHFAEKRNYTNCFITLHDAHIRFGLERAIQHMEMMVGYHNELQKARSRSGKRHVSEFQSDLVKEYFPTKWSNKKKGKEYYLENHGDRRRTPHKELVDIYHFVRLVRNALCHIEAQSHKGHFFEFQPISKSSLTYRLVEATKATSGQNFALKSIELLDEIFSRTRECYEALRSG